MYDGGTGERVRTVGRAGAGPGEFSSLISAQTYGDSLVASDFALHRVSVLSNAGVQARELVLASKPYDVRVLDDSLLLAIRHPGQGGKLLSISYPLISLDTSPDWMARSPGIALTVQRSSTMNS